ncbi:MAG: hypothetical protein ACI965_000052 [Paraglaciecola sp.]|jgi:hypothetical protein
MNMEILGIIVAIVGAILLLGLGIKLLGKFIQGAGIVFAFASEQGFIGFAICLACFVFMFPVMLIISVIVALWGGEP